LTLGAALAISEYRLKESGGIVNLSRPVHKDGRQSMQNVELDAMLVHRTPQQVRFATQGDDISMCDPACVALLSPVEFGVNGVSSNTNEGSPLAFI